MTDKNLIFLISLPRSGSTLTQKILGSHSQIYTRSEPWIMLHSLYSLKENGMTAEYNKNFDYTATQDFINNLPSGGRKKYTKSLCDMHLSLYQDYLKNKKQKFFLDKTPRYYLILDELQEVFTNAKFILLIRNPLAVLSSIITTWNKDDLSSLSNFKIDLIEGLEVIVKRISDTENKIHILHYEKILTNPVTTFQSSFKYLNIKFEKSIIYNYNQSTEGKWQYGDQENVYKKDGIDADNDIKWIDTLSDPQHWRLIYEYLLYIGKERFEILGYDFDYYQSLLLKKQPLHSIYEIEKDTISLKILLKLENTKNKHKIDKLLEENQKIQQIQKELEESIREVKNTKFIQHPILKYKKYKTCINKV